jgi:threonine synthase
MAVAVSKAAELGVNGLVVPSAGNAGGAMAAYCAKAGLEAHVYMPQDTPIANKKEADVMAAHLTLVDGLITDAGKAARAYATARGLFDLSTMREPYRVEGKKTMGYEIAMDFNWKLPEVIVYPTGGGTGIVGIWKAFEEMETLGWIGSDRPRMIAIQAEGCAPIVRAFENGTESAEPWEDAETVAAGIRVPAAIGDYLILKVVRESGGTAITVSDDEIIASVHQIAQLEGIWPAPEGAATLAGYDKLIKTGQIDPSASTVLLNTGSGLKYQDLT